MRSRVTGLIDSKPKGVGNYRTFSLTRTLPVTLNDAVDIGSFYVDHGPISLQISVAVADSNFSQTKHYTVNIQFGGTGGMWAKVVPTQTTNWATNDFDLDLKMDVMTLSLRLRKTVGTDAGTAWVHIVDMSQMPNLVFTPSSATAAVAAPTISYPGWTAVTFATGWANYGADWQTVGFRRKGDVVTLRGLANSGVNAWATYRTIFTLPAGFAPPATLIYVPRSSGTGNNGQCRLDIQSNGVVGYLYGGLGSGWISLDGISFSVSP